MSAQDDVKVGLQATVHATRDDVIAACTRAAASLGNHASATASSAKVTVKILPGLVKSMSKASPTVGVDLKPGNDGQVVLRAKVEQYLIFQSRLFFIPFGPKQLVGKSYYQKFLTALERELQALDSGKGSIQRIGAGK